MRTSRDHAREFGALFDAHSSAVLRYLARRCSLPAAEDALAETFLIVWRRLDRVPDDPLPWMLGIARWVLAQQSPGAERQRALFGRLRPAADPEDLTWEAAASVGDDLARALLSLSPRDREALLLTAWEGLSPERAAVAAGCGVPAFRVRLDRARRVVAAELERVRRRAGPAMASEEAA